MLHQGVHLLQRFAQDDRIKIPDPTENTQIKLNRTLAGGNEFVSYIDAIGSLDGQRCLIDWKTTTSRYSEEPDGLLSLDPQLICYSWMSGISDVAFVVFVRKSLPEIQYLKATISEEQRRDFGRIGRDDRWSTRSRPVPFPQRYTLPAERLHELLSSGALPEQPAIDRDKPNPASRSE